MKESINIVVAGAAGQGIQSAAEIIGKTLLRMGYFVFITQDVQSRVRGGHNFMTIRFSSEEVNAAVRTTDYLLALNGESIGLRKQELAPDGLILCRESDKGEEKDPRMRTLSSAQGAAGTRSDKFTAVKLSAMLFAMLGFNEQVLSESVRSLLGGRVTPEMVSANIDAVGESFRYVKQSDIRPLTVKPGIPGDRLLVSGNDAVALGMVAAGIGVYSGYPITPATSIMNSLALFGNECGVVVEQAEDEIAAINIVIGASYAGARAACGTSGAGISLMTESIGLAGITETPLVIYNGQRSGPAVGMATRTEQSDLLFMAHASHGEFPRAILSPANHEDSFYLTAEAFNIADEFQVPVFLANDLGMADSLCTVPLFDPGRVQIRRGLFADEPDSLTVLNRYAVTDSGVSPRAIPARSNWVVSCDCHEHDEVGHLTDNPQNRVRQVDKRMRKVSGMAARFPGPDIINPGERTCLIVWGSTAGPVIEARELLAIQGMDFSIAVFRYLYPLDKEKIRGALAPFATLITIEQNYSGQLGKLLQMECGITIDRHLGKYDGRTLTVDDVVQLVSKAIGGAA